MRPTRECREHLLGRSFSGAYDASFEFDGEDRRYRGRVEVLREICLGQKVIHVGFLEHSAELAMEKLRQGKWLHADLCEVTKRCFGVDLDEDQVESLRNLGFRDIAAVDILESDHPAFGEHPWDQILLPEVLEHVDNPVSFLQGLRKRFQGRARELIITVPNAFTPKAVDRSIRDRIEHINSDHRYWFTPYTICKVIYCAGLEVESLLTCHGSPINKWHPLRQLWHRRHPLNGRRIIVKARLD